MNKFTDVGAMRAQIDEELVALYDDLGAGKLPMVLRCSFAVKRAINVALEDTEPLVTRSQVPRLPTMFGPVAIVVDEQLPGWYWLLDYSAQINLDEVYGGFMEAANGLRRIQREREKIVGGGYAWEREVKA